MRLLAGVASPVNGVMWLGVFVPFANAIVSEYTSHVGI